MDLLFNGLLEALARQSILALAFVDDLAVVLLGRTRAEIDVKGALAVSAVQEWCSKVKLELAADGAVPAEGEPEHAEPSNHMEGWFKH